ncbi:MAG TPA: hypothetical protein PJ982_02155, partial [Lacipirellulaceae bacterium]|nr:hypothetical protein [Lacipirellulaceae bacterium]
MLKALSAADAAATQSLYAVPHWLQVVAVQAEIAVGVLLMSGLGPRQAWRATVALFLTFASMSLYRALAGLESCGCFGSFKINPWWTFGLDVAILLLLAYRRQDFLRDVEAARSEKWPWLGGYALLASLAITEMVSSAPIRYEAAKPILDGQLVILEPEKWPGQPFSLSEHVEPEIEFSKGDWIILMYHHDCPSCQEAVPRY